MKLLSGLDLDTYSFNTPDDNQIERIQIARYPPTGWIEPHADPTPIIRLIISGYLSKRGVDYDEGGYVFDLTVVFDGDPYPISYEDSGSDYYPTARDISSITMNTIYGEISLVKSDTTRINNLLSNNNFPLTMHS